MCSEFINGGLIRCFQKFARDSPKRTTFSLGTYSECVYILPNKPCEKIRMTQEDFYEVNETMYTQKELPT